MVPIELDVYIRRTPVHTVCASLLLRATHTSFPTSDPLFYYIVIHRRRSGPVGGTFRAQKVGLGGFLWWAEV